MNKFLTMICAASLFISAAYAQQNELSEDSSDVTVITSDKLTFDYVKQYAFFEGNVVVVDPKMKIYADTMMVKFTEENKVNNIKAEGNVVIIQEDKRAKSDIAEYKVDTGEIELRGSPMLTSGRNILTADVVRFWRDENRALFEPNSRIVIYPDEKTNQNLFGDPQ